MADVTVKRTEDFEATFRGGMLKARSGLEVTSFGMQLLRFPPNATRYPEHDHTANGQEEVYTVLDGAAGATVLALGGVPGAPFEPTQFTEEGEPDPLDG